MECFSKYVRTNVSPEIGEDFLKLYTDTHGINIFEGIPYSFLSSSAKAQKKYCCGKLVMFYFRNILLEVLHGGVIYRVLYLGIQP